jgi:aromatic ring-opening dioxygenase catalytic subunit (LigB family)
MSMAKIVLGIGSSHTPMLNLTAEQWSHRANVDFNNTKLALPDGRKVSYPQLLEMHGPRFQDEITLPVLQRKERACQDALDRLGDAIEQARPDVVVVIGDDQAELFDSNNQPAFAIYHGEEIVTTARRYADGAPDWMRQVGRGYLMEEVHRLPASPVIALQVIEALMDRDVDVSAAAGVTDPNQAGFGHAYGFIAKRLFRRPIPMLPVLLNTYFPPNVVSAARAYDIGRKLRDVIEAIPQDLRVAVVASGGLSHFVIDAEFDQQVLAALRAKDVATLRAIPRERLKSGTSETLNWVMTAGAVDHLQFQWSEYQPLYRTAAGTGTGAAFCAWS